MRLTAFFRIKAQLLQLKRSNREQVICYRTARAFFNAEGKFAGALEFLQPHADTAPISESAGAPQSFHGLLSRDPVMQEAIKIIRNVAETEATVLIRGESSTGKELVAKALHRESHRHAKPFLAINCAAITPSLL